MTNAGSMTDDAAARREGIVTGLLGAGVVALFYLAVDLARGKALMTPTVLGEVFVLRNTDPTFTGPALAPILLYTLLHVIAFIALGLLLAATMRRAETSSLMRYALVQILIAFEIFFYGVLAVMSETARGMFPLWGVLTANTLAAIVMGRYLWRRHPAVAHAIHHTPLGADAAH